MDSLTSIFKCSKCYYMPNIFERGCSQLFPGTKILKNDSVAEENARCEVGAVNTEEITSQIGKFQSSTIGKPFVFVNRFRKMCLMHPNMAPTFSPTLVRNPTQIREAAHVGPSEHEQPGRCHICWEFRT